MCNCAYSLRLVPALVVAVHSLFHRKILLAQSVRDGLQSLIPRRHSGEYREAAAVGEAAAVLNRQIPR
jgi:hypothetical protein